MARPAFRYRNAQAVRLAAETQRDSAGAVSKPALPNQSIHSRANVFACARNSSASDNPCSCARFHARCAAMARTYCS
jgi:hypothetical protein